MGGVDMATSSIIENIRVNNPRVLEEWIIAMEESANNYKPRSDDERSGVITDKEETKAFMTKALAKKGIIL